MSVTAFKMNLCPKLINVLDIQYHFVHEIKSSKGPDHHGPSFGQFLQISGVF